MKEKYSPPLPLLPPSLFKKLSTELSAENICLPRNKCNFISDLSGSPSGWREEFLPRNRSETNKMPSVGKLKHWTLWDGSPVGRSDVFLLNTSTMVGWERILGRRGSQITRSTDVCPHVFPGLLSWQSHHLGMSTISASSVLVVFWLLLMILSGDKGSAA